MSKKTKTLIDVILNLNEIECARASNDLNAWEWPEEFPSKFKPGDWRDGESTQTCSEHHRILGPFLDSRTTKEILDSDWDRRYCR